MLLELTARLAGLPHLEAEARALRRPHGAPRAFFPVAGRFALKLAEERTPAVARSWGFLLNMSEESMRTFLVKQPIWSSDEA